MANWHKMTSMPPWSGNYRVRSSNSQRACWAWFNRTQQQWLDSKGHPLSKEYDQWRVSTKKESEQMNLNSYAAVKQG